MRHSILCFSLVGVAACGQAAPEQEQPLGETSEPIVNGTVTISDEFKAVVGISGPTSSCSGTFIHPNFVLTAAHCLPLCSSTITSGCVPVSDEDDIYSGDSHWVGRDGTLSGYNACTGADFCTTGGGGTIHPIDRVFFPSPFDFDPNVASLDLAILHTPVPFLGKPIAVMSAGDLPSPSNLCDRYELTRPIMAGFSDNNAGIGKLRRTGIAEVECDIEMDDRAFKVDGHGRPFTGSRACPGDSGGPALWRNGSDVLGLGGVISYGDVFNIFTDVACPSERGETGLAFVARPFIDRTVSSLTVTTQHGGSGRVVSTPAGIDCTGDGSDCFEQYDLAKVVTLQAVPATGSFFEGWTGACSGTAPTCTLTVSSALSVGARFALLQPLLTVGIKPASTGSIRVNPPNTDCTGGGCLQHLDYGTTVTLTATPAAGYVLASWSGDCAGNHSTTCTVQMTTVRHVTASFCEQNDLCCLNPASCHTCNPKQCPRGMPDCCEE